MSTFEPHHINVCAEQLRGRDGSERVFLLPGSSGRARRIAEDLDDHELLPSDRGLDVHLGRFEEGDAGVDVAVISTGMGCPSVDIVVTEIIMLGGRTFIRVGTAGSMQPQTVCLGDFVIAAAAVRDEATSDAYVTRDFPAIADLEVTRALTAAAQQHGLADRTFCGVVHTKDSLFAREFGQGPRSEENRAYTQQLRGLGVLASEMEAAHLFILGHVHSTNSARVRTGALLAIVGDESGFADSKIAEFTESRAAQLALTAALELCGSKRDRSHS